MSGGFQANLAIVFLEHHVLILQNFFVQKGREHNGDEIHLHTTKIRPADGFCWPQLFIIAPDQGHCNCQILHQYCRAVFVILPSSFFPGKFSLGGTIKVEEGRRMVGLSSGCGRGNLLLSLWYPITILISSYYCVISIRLASANHLPANLKRPVYFRRVKGSKCERLRKRSREKEEPNASITRRC